VEARNLGVIDIFFERSAVYSFALGTVNAYAVLSTTSLACSAQQGGHGSILHKLPTRSFLKIIG